MAWPKGRPRGAQQGNAAEAPGAEAGSAAESAVAVAPESLPDFREWAERLKIPDGVVLVELSHPDAPSESTVWPGAFSGYRSGQGVRSAKWSDGTSFSG